MHTATNGARQSAFSIPLPQQSRRTQRSAGWPSVVGSRCRLSDSWATASSASRPTPRLAAAPMKATAAAKLTRPCGRWPSSQEVRLFTPMRTSPTKSPTPQAARPTCQQNHSMLWFSSAALLSSRGCSKRWKPAWAATSAAATSAAKPEAYSRAACMAPSESTALPSATSSSASRTLTKGRTPLRSQSDAGGFGLTPTNTSLPPAWGPIFRPERDRGDSLRSCCADSGDDGGEVEIAPGCVFSMPVDTARRFSMSISRGANAGRPPTPRCCCCSRVFCSSIGRGVRVGGPRAVG
mmetsp:Transcript_40386/g.126403  ORF Transcript_40386/g.126403 Transcript_40386/m.126403 type:complete len:294 (-) Transcript_40386:48-929(-)